MVIIEGAFIARMNAQQLASTLVAWRTTAQDGYFKLTYVSTDGLTERTVLLRPRDDSEVSSFANRSEYIACETPEGEEIGLLVPRFEARRSHDVIVLTTQATRS